jgi:hypothetical protein
MMMEREKESEIRILDNGNNKNNMVNKIDNCTH